MNKNATTTTDYVAADSADASVVRPVRSAKDAINAMYAEHSDTNLSDYLATSAKEIINSKGNSKSAANLHSHSATTKSRLKARPSASGMLRAAKTEKKTPVVHDLTHAMDPLAQRNAPVETKRVVERPAAPQSTPTMIKTSLKLSPKKAATRSKTLQANTPRATDFSINGQKGQTSLSKMWAQRRAAARAQMAKSSTDPIAQAPSKPTRPTVLDSDTADTIQTMQQAVQQTAKSRPKKTRRTSGLMQDIMRQPRNIDGFSRPTPDFASAGHPDSRPADSVKRRFKTAPKGYTATPEVQDETYDTFSDTASTSNKPPVEIYGMMEEDYTIKSEGLGVVEDYHPNGDQVSAGISEQKVAHGSGSAAQAHTTPDNNKYAIKGQSPFFLKSVSVEKRPLSDAPRQTNSTKSKRQPSDGTLYEHPSTQPIGGKNVYDKKEAKKPLPTKPTVIIPAARKSKAPLVILLILTIILGAAVGAFAYLCFFQYME